MNRHRIQTHPRTLLFASLLLGACAAAVPVRSARLAPLAEAAHELQVTQAAELRLSTGYTRVLPAGSRWSAVGLLPEGTVYRPVDGVFAIEGRNVHEAWIVLRAGSLQGFYLPGESAFSPLDPPLSLPTGAR